MGATLFMTPGLKGGVDVSGLGIVLFVVLVVIVGLILGRHRGSRPGPPDQNPGDGWRKRPPPPDSPRPNQPRGGIPLEDAVPARVRLRGRGRLADLVPRRERRPAREPERDPART